MLTSKAGMNTSVDYELHQTQNSERNQQQYVPPPAAEKKADPEVQKETFSDQFKTWYSQSLAETNKFTDSDEKLLKIIQKQINHQNPFKFVYICFLIVCPYIIFGYQNLTRLRNISGCTDKIKGDIGLGICISCNDNSVTVVNGIFPNPNPNPKPKPQQIQALIWNILIYLLWIVTFVFMVYQYIKMKHMAAQMTLLLQYRIRIKTTLRQVIQQNYCIFLMMWTLYFFCMAFTYCIRNQIEKTFTGKCDKEGGLDLTYTLMGDDYNAFQGIILLIMSILYTYVIVYKILCQEMNPMNEFFGYNSLFHSDFDKESAYLLQTLNTIQWELTLLQFFDQLGKVIKETGFKKPFYFFTDNMQATILMMTVNNIRRDKICTQRKSFE